MALPTPKFESPAERKCQVICTELSAKHRVIVEFAHQNLGDYVMFFTRGVDFIWQCTVNNTTLATASINELVQTVERGLHLVETKVKTQEVKKKPNEDWADEWIKNNG